MGSDRVVKTSGAIDFKTAPQWGFALYFPNRGLKPEALMAGVTPGKPADVARYMLKPDVKMLAF